MASAEETFLEAAEAYCVAKHNFDIARAPGGWVCGPAHRYDPTPELRAMMKAYKALRTERANTPSERRAQPRLDVSAPLAPHDIPGRNE